MLVAESFPYLAGKVLREKQSLVNPNDLISRHSDLYGGCWDSPTFLHLSTVIKTTKLAELCKYPTILFSLIPTKV